MIDLDALRAAYVERFGPLFDSVNAVELVDCPDDPVAIEPFYVLQFWQPTRPDARFVYATLGAPGGEVVIVAVAPLIGMAHAIVTAVLSTQGERAPLELLRIPKRSSLYPWRAFLVLPPEEGSFTIACGAGRRAVFFAAPLTVDEWSAFAKDAHALYERLQRAGAFLVDPLRSCTRNPAKAEWSRTIDIPHVVRLLREDEAEFASQLAERHADGAGSIDSEERALLRIRASLRHLEEDGPYVLTDAELSARFTEGDLVERTSFAIVTIVARSLVSFGDSFPLPVLWRSHELLTVVFHTQPEAVRVLAELVGHRLHAPREGAGSRAFLAHLESSVVTLVSGLHPDRNALALTKQARAGAIKAESTPRVSRGKREGHVWACVVKASYEDMQDRTTRQGRAAAAAFAVVIDACADFCHAERRSSPPLERLVSVGVGAMVRATFAHASSLMREDGTLAEFLALSRTPR